MYQSKYQYEIGKTYYLHFTDKETDLGKLRIFWSHKADKERLKPRYLDS